MWFGCLLQVEGAQDMEGKKVIVTGASRGIGVFIARELASCGADLLLVARSEPELVRLADELRNPANTVAVAAVDLAGTRAAQQVVAAAEAELGRVDVLVNNAAVEPQRRFVTLDPDEIERVLRVDLITPIELSRRLLPGMLQRGYGRIVNISSLAGRTGFPFTEAYAASKDGLIAFSRVLRNDHRAAGVSSSAVVLGAVKETGIGQRTLDETGLKGNTAFMVGPEKVAKAVVRAIEKDGAEIVVMRGPGRLIKALMDLFPGFGSTMNRVSGAEELMGKVADLREAQHVAALGKGWT
ncbi:MAG: SDR family NAD(P)-dependent oxidoreductase [Actinobacteria bacterium]|nr:MAG: SDR family NAD(P)-dependent oxidoreductase [Actinomycetota bacterium]